LEASRLDRVLRLFTVVRPGEGTTALLMFANVFLILLAYYFIKPLREGWIAISDIGELSKMEVKAYSSFGQTLLLIPIATWYGRLAERQQRAALINRTTLFCMSNMVVFWVVQPGLFVEGLPVSGIFFYLWVGMFGVFIVAQFWAFAADIYDQERGERMMPVVAIGATAGAASGSWVTERLVATGWVPTEWLLIAALVPLSASMFLTRLISRRESVPEGNALSPAMATEKEEKKSGRSAISIVLSSRFLLATALITLLLNWVNTNGENLLFEFLQRSLAQDAVSQGVEGEEALLAFTRSGTTLFYSGFFLWVNVVALLLQGFVAARLLRYGGFGAALMLLPVVALVSYTAMAVVPILALVRAMKIAENSTDYSINNTARHVLWLPLDAETKYKGKTTIDSLFARLGDGFAAVTVLVCVQLLVLPIESFILINISLVVLWLAFSLIVVREHSKITQKGATDEA
jgi:AAA family ATP:ADP antiporter